MNKINVQKASEELEPYDDAKLRRSLTAVGADEEIINHIVDRVDKVLYDGITTKKLYKEAFRLLKHHSSRSAGRYKLKEALLELGPTGYPFEKFIAELLNRLGYDTQVGQIIEGNCVSHEVDVIAEKDDEFFIVECKFHNRRGHKCKVQVPLYIQARFEDIKRKLNHQSDYQNKNFHGWVVTNTRFTENAERYGNCIGLRLLSWNFPKTNGLKDLIGRVNLHPITCLSTISSREKQQLLEQDIVFCKQLHENGQLLLDIGINKQRKQQILNEAIEISKSINVNTND